jgi:hypothetical protein
VSAALGALALGLAAFVPERLPRAALLRRGFGALGALALLPSGASGSWPFVLLAVGAAVAATPLPLVLAASGAVLVALRPEASPPVAVGVAALAAASAAHGLDAARQARRASGADASVAALAAGLLVALVLATVDGGAVLTWSFGVGTGTERVLLSGVGLPLGAALVAALGGVLLLGAATLAPPAPGARKAGLGALGVAAALAVLGTAVALVQLTSLPEGLRSEGGRPLALLVGATGVLALLLREAAASPAEVAGSAESPRSALAFRVAAALAVAAAIAAGVEGWWRDGTYATDLTAASTSAALLGLAALEPLARLEGVPRLLFLAAVLALVLA